MTRGLKNRKLTIRSFIWTLVLVWLCYYVLLSNNGLHFLFEDKIWAHRVNSTEKYAETKAMFSGVEIDVIYDTTKGVFDVNHPPAPSINLSLLELLKTKSLDNENRYWLDYKNLDSTNVEVSINRLNSIVKDLNLSKSVIIVESNAPKYVSWFTKEGYQTSYYLPNDLYMMNATQLNTRILSLKDDLSNYDISFISADHKNYKLLRSKFPNKEILTWKLGKQGHLDKIKTRLRVYKLALDKKVKVILISYDSKLGNR
jgi:hypothetical protein